MTTQRTLTAKGVKEVDRVCGSKNSTTHTFTVMPIISRGGELKKDVFVILQETQGKFGCEIAKDMVKYSKKYKNLVIVCSKSGKVEKGHLKIWFEKCMKKLVSEKSLLLLDAYGSHKTKKKEHQKQQENESNSPNSEEEIDELICELLDIEIIPESTTSMIQPLDKFFFRQFKIVYRKIVNIQVQKNNKDPVRYQPVHLREVQLRLISLVHSQFAAPAFRFMVRGAWSLCGYQMPDDEPPERFEAANEILFKLDKVIMCTNDECSNVSFINCAHCRKIVCFDCFVHTDEHFHFDEDLEPTILDYDSLGMVKESTRRKKNPASPSGESPVTTKRRGRPPKTV